MAVVTVYVWVSLIKARSPGHAAMQIGDATFPNEGYMSFAPLVESKQYPSHLAR